MAAAALVRCAQTTDVVSQAAFIYGIPPREYNELERANSLVRALVKGGVHGISGNAAAFSALNCSIAYPLATWVWPSATFLTCGTDACAPIEAPFGKAAVRSALQKDPTRSAWVGGYHLAHERISRLIRTNEL